MHVSPDDWPCPPNAPMTAALAKYAKVFNVGAQNTFVYRWNFILRSVFGIVPLIGTIFLWRAMYTAAAARR